LWLAESELEHANLVAQAVYVAVGNDLLKLAPSAVWTFERDLEHSISRAALSLGGGFERSNEARLPKIERRRHLLLEDLDDLGDRARKLDAEFSVRIGGFTERGL
jgi:hypothetical protein